MHFPSPSDYLPFDSDAPAAFAKYGVTNYIFVAFMALVLYDHMITLGIEIERIWTLRWGLPKVLFLFSRYVIVPMLMLILATKTSYPLLFSFCTFETRFREAVSALSLFAVNLVLFVRVSALYGHSKIILSFLACLLVCQVAAMIITTVVILKTSTPALYYEFLPGCWLWTSYSKSSLSWQFSWWIPFICGDGLLFILTLIKAFSYRGHFNPTIRLLARDSILYSAIMFACLVENVVVFSAPAERGHVAIPAELTACIAMSRMMMSIRSLAFNDPLSTQRLKFSTMVFGDQNPAENGDNSQHAAGGV